MKRVDWMLASKGKEKNTRVCEKKTLQNDSRRVVKFKKNEQPCLIFNASGVIFSRGFFNFDWMKPSKKCILREWWVNNYRIYRDKRPGRLIFKSHKKNPITHRFHVHPPLENHPSKAHRFFVLPPLKNHCFWVGVYFGKYGMSKVSIFLSAIMLFFTWKKTLTASWWCGNSVEAICLFFIQP